MENPESQTTWQQILQQDDSRRLLKDWHTEWQVLLKYTQHQVELWFIISDFQSVRNLHFFYITAAIHLIELLEIHTEPVHSAPYQESLETRELEKAEMSEMI